MRICQAAFWSILLCSHSLVSAQSLEPAWKFQASARILASPVAADGICYIGDENGQFYAIDAVTGQQKWSVATDGKVQAQACLTKSLVVFESKNVVYALNRADSKLIWKHALGKPRSYSLDGQTHVAKIDPYDDIRSAPVEHQGVIYIGSGLGRLVGLHSQNGTVQFEIRSDNDSPIRTTPLIASGKLFFGDWNGVVYCVDLATKKVDWKKKTYRHKPYATFGGVVSEFAIHDGLLFFGARNFMMNVLLLEDGQKEWTYTDPEKGWMIGHPVIADGTLFIGGSDNFSMFAFDPVIGQKKWVHRGGRNVYTRPLVTEQSLLYTGGNGYDAKDFGMLFWLNREDGKLLAEFKVPQGVFSSPIRVNDLVIFGCYDHFVYGVRMKTTQASPR